MFFSAVIQKIGLNCNLFARFYIYFRSKFLYCTNFSA